MRLISFAVLAVVASSCAAPQQVNADPASPTEALDQAVTRAANLSKAGAILDVQGCGLSFRQARGVADRKTKAPMPLNEPLRIASVGKLYTAAVIQQLAAQGQIDLDASATTYLTKGELDGVPNATATVRQMLNHTSGVPDYYDVRSVLLSDWTKPITPERVFQIARRRDAENAPGAAYSYSNTNYHILGLVAESVSGKTLGELIGTQLIGPLKFSATQYNTQHWGGTIHGYGTYLSAGADTWKYADNTGADSGISATTEEISQYLGALFFEDGALASTGAAMLADRVARDKPRQFAGAGAEMLVSRTGKQLVGHTGSTLGYLTFAFAIPEDNVTLVGHINADKKDAFNELLGSTVVAVMEACGDGAEPAP